MIFYSFCFLRFFTGIVSILVEIVSKMGQYEINTPSIPLFARNVLALPGFFCLLRGLVASFAIDSPP